MPDPTAALAGELKIACNGSGAAHGGSRNRRPRHEAYRADDRFDNVSVVKKANVYYDGKVRPCEAGESFSVSANASFKLEIAGVADCCCTYPR